VCENDRAKLQPTHTRAQAWFCVVLNTGIYTYACEQNYAFWKTRKYALVHGREYRPPLPHLILVDAGELCPYFDLPCCISFVMKSFHIFFSPI
jgi:hypothetical protein